MSASLGISVTMERYTGPQRSFCVKAFYENNHSYIQVRRLYRARFNLHDINQAPTRPLIRYWVAKFDAEGTTVSNNHIGRPRVGRSAENIERVRAAVRRTPRRSIRKHAAALTLTKSTVHMILKKDLKFHPYKIQIVQALKVEDYPVRVAFAQHMLQNFDNFDNILFSDEAHFHLNGAVNKQNCRYWGNNNPREKHQQPLHSPKVTVWAAMSAHGIIGPFFFEDANHRTVTVNSERYRAMLENFLEPELQNFAGFNQNTWFQQDGATAHTANLSMQVVQRMFPEKVISKNGDINWPPRSPDLTVMDFFLWGFLKAKVYTEIPANLNQLKQRIRDEIRAIPQELCVRVFAHFRECLAETVRVGGQHLDGIIFHK